MTNLFSLYLDILNLYLGINVLLKKRTAGKCVVMQWQPSARKSRQFDLIATNSNPRGSKDIEDAFLPLLLGVNNGKVHLALSTSLQWLFFKNSSAICLS